MTTNKTRPSYIAIDQHGTVWRWLQYPRRDLCARIGRKHVSKMYVDRSDGRHVQIGYVIGGLWLTVYEVNLWERAA